MTLKLNYEEIHKLHSFLLEKNRLKTFKKWIFPDNSPCSAQKMAEAGFVFIGGRREPDLVNCFLCKKSLDGWDETDDPWAEHLSHAPYCSFAKTKTKMDNLTYRQFLMFSEEIVHKYIERVHQDLIDQVEIYNSVLPN